MRSCARLKRREVELSSVGLGTMLAREATAALVPEVLVGSTIQAVVATTAGQGGASPAASPHPANIRFTPLARNLKEEVKKCEISVTGGRSAPIGD